jgi:SAM-dependent methyltransferase
LDSNGLDRSLNNPDQFGPKDLVHPRGRRDRLVPREEQIRPDPNWYAQIADLYDGLIRYDEDIPFFLEACKAAEGEVLELMAGTGRVSVPLLEAGIPLTCVDRSPEMLARLRAKLHDRRLTATVVESDVRQLALPRKFALAILPFNSFSEVVEESDRKAVLGRVREYLEPRGRFICTLHNPSVRIRRMKEAPHEERRFPDPAGRGDVIFRLFCEFRAASGIAVGTETFEIYSPASELLERREVPIRFCLPEEGWFREAAGEAGFTIESLHGDYDGSEFHESSSPYMIWSLAKGGNE